MSAVPLFQYVLEHAASRPDDRAMLAATEGPFCPVTWREVEQYFLRTVAALASFRIQPQQRVVLWSENRTEWIAIDLAISALGAVHIPIHRDLPVPSVMAQIEFSQPALVIVSQREAASQLRQALTGRAVTVPIACLGAWDGQPAWSDRLAQADPQRGSALLQEYLPHHDPTQIATILFSSGTTGTAKAVALSHANLAFNTEATIAAFGEQPADLRLCFLPLSHIYARTCDLYAWLVRGSQLALARSRDTVIDDLKAVQPSLINAVPYFYDRIARRVSESEQTGHPLTIQQILGSQIRACFCGGAALSPETYRFFHDRGVLLLPGYGLTECSPVVALSTPDFHRAGTVGRVLQGTQVTIADDGEILVRGPHVMLGYWNDPVSTDQVIQEGWLHTGDLGSLDGEGFLTITGRKKEMLVLSTGKKAFPSQLEERLCRDPLILQALVVGDGRKYLAALLVPDPDTLKAEIRRRGLWVFSRRQAVRHPQIVQLYEERVRAQLADAAPHEQISRFRILDRGFTLDDGHLTPKLTLRRENLLRDFRQQIEELYASGVD